VSSEWTNPGGGPSPAAVTTPGHRGQVAPARDGGEQRGKPGLAFPLQHTVDCAVAMRDDRRRGEGGAVAADADEGQREARLGGACEIDDLRDVGEVVAGEGDRFRPPALDQAKIGAVAFDLQIDQPDIVPGLPGGLRHQFEPQRLQPQEDLGVHQRPGMNAENLHRIAPMRPRRRVYSFSRRSALPLRILRRSSAESGTVFIHSVPGGLSTKG